jgi:CPA1 family monovalent cation:H+ antiporter
MNMNELISIETLVLEILLMVSVVAIVTRRFRLPYTVVLVLAGLILSLRSRLELSLTPQLILSLFLPPLVFEAAFQLSVAELRRSLVSISLLAVPGVVLNMLVVGGIVSVGAGIPLGVALVFGALISATDPVSVVAMFRKLGVPKRLEVLLEGESLLNDGTAIVVFQIALAAVLSGHFSLVDGLFDFIVVAGGGLGVGLALGWLTSRLLAGIDDYLVETTLTTVLAFGSYLLAEQFHVSGVLAVVAAGLVIGNTVAQSMSPTTRTVVNNFWEYIAFLANSAVFLLIGLSLDIRLLLADWRAGLWAIAGVLVSRALAVYVLPLVGRDIPVKWRHVLFWGGLRGALALALVLSLTPELGDARQTILVMVFWVVLFTILVQGTSMRLFLRRLGVVERSDAQLEFERRHARVLASRAGFEHAQRLYGEGFVSAHTWERLRPVVQARLEVLARGVQDALRDEPEMEQQEVMSVRRESLRAERSMLASLRRDGVISDPTYEELVGEIDLGLEEGVEKWAARILQSGPRPDIRELLMVVVQQRDLEAASEALALLGVPNTHLQSSGGFLRHPNQVLLVGVPYGRLDKIVETLGRVCRTRVEYLATPLPGMPPGVAAPMEITVRGATVFVFPVARYEEI